MIGEWMIPDGSDIPGVPPDNPILGHIIQRLFDIVHPPSVSKLQLMECVWICNIVLASQQVVWVSFWHPNPQKSHLRTPIIFQLEIFLNVNFKHIIEFFPPQYNFYDIAKAYYALFQ